MPVTKDPSIGGLVLSRRANEAIVLVSPEGVTVEFSVIELRGDKARLLTRAPKTWRIMRKEIMEETTPCGS